jgi:hypothetical protein
METVNAQRTRRLFTKAFLKALAEHFRLHGLEAEAVGLDRHRKGAW